MKKKFLKNKENTKEMYIIISNINRLYKRGIPIVKAIEMLESLPIKGQYKKSLREITFNIKSGESFYDSFKNYKGLYSEFFISMINIGEKTGELAKVLEGLELYYKSQNLINNKIVSILLYPIIILITLILTILLMVRVVIPSIYEVFESLNSNIPKIIEIMMRINKIIDERPLIFFISFVCWGFVLPSIIIIYKKERIKNFFRSFKINKIINEFISVVLLRMLFSSGINLSKGISCCCDTNIYDIKHIFLVINNEINQGKSISEALKETKVFNEQTVAYIKIGEECGDVKNVLENLEKEMLENLEGFLNNSMQWIQPIIILVIGTIIVLSFFNIVMPIIDTIYGGSFL